MRIAMVSEHASPLATLGGVDAGGQNVHVAALASAVAKRGHEVVVYTRRDDAGLAEQVHLRPGVVVEHLDAGPPTAVPKDDLIAYVPAMAADLQRRLKGFEPVVVHAHFWMSGLAALDAAAPLRLPVVQTFHALGTVKRRFQGAADTSPPSRCDDEHRIAVEADRLLASCTDEVRELVQLGASRRSIDVVPSGVDRARFTPDGPVAPRSRRHRLLVVGRLVPRKGVDDVIRALAHLPYTELVIAGGPDADQLHRDPEAQRLHELAAELDVDGRVTMLGRVPPDELPALMRSADVVVCLPWYEPFGIVPLEAMACGVPVVGTAVGGLLDTIVDGVTGVLLPPRQPEQVAAAIAPLLEDPQRRARLGRGGCDRAARFDWSRVARSAERSYLRAVLARRNARERLTESVG